MCVSLSKHFGTRKHEQLGRYGWRDTIRRAGTAEGRWCQSQSDWWHVAHATCQCAIPCNKSFDKAICQNSGRIRLKLCGPMATIGKQNPFGDTMVLPSWHALHARGTCLWYMARDLTTLVIATERLIRFGPDRRRTTQESDGNVFLSIYGCSRNGTWHVPYNLTKLSLEPKLVARSRRGKRHSIFLYDRKTIRSATFRFVKSEIDSHIVVRGSNPSWFKSFLIKVYDFGTMQCIKECRPLV